MYRVLLENARSDDDRFRAAREGKIGGSDMAAILGLNPYRSPLAVWAQMTGRLAAPIENNSMWLGKKLEPIIGALFERVTELKVEPVDQVWQHASIDWLIATPDFTLTENGELGLLETKSSKIYAAKYWEDGAPDAAHVQSHVQMLVADQFRFGYCAALIGGNADDLKTIRFQRDPAIEEQLIAAGEKFLELVKSDTPPAATSDDSPLIKSLFKMRKGVAVTDQSPDAVKIARKYFDVCARRDKVKPVWESLEDERKALGAAIMLRAEGAEYLETPVGKFTIQHVSGSTFTTTREPYAFVKKGTPDATAIAAMDAEAEAKRQAEADAADAAAGGDADATV